MNSEFFSGELAMIITKPMVCDILSAYNIVEYIAEDTAQAFETVEFITG